MSTHITFTDKTVINSVGKEVEYSVKSLQQGKGFSDYSYSPGSTDTVYRIPFLSTIIGTVHTKSGVGVYNVTITVCHINPITAVNDNYGTAYCPLFYNLTTDARGHFESEIRVSDAAWTRVEEHFNISASYTEYLSLDSSGIIVHEFEPSHQIVSMRQVYPSKINFIDKTAVSIFGSVRIDPSNTDGKDCVFANVPIHLVHSNGQVDNTTSATDGSFNFSVSRGETAYVYIPDYQGYTWDSFVRSAVTTNSTATTVAAAVTTPPTSAPVFIPDYIATSEWPQETGIGKGLFDFNWIHTVYSDVNGVTKNINFPARILTGNYIGPPITTSSSAGWYYFATTFSLPDFANYTCLSIPFVVNASGSTSVEVNLNNHTLQAWTLTDLQPINTLTVGTKDSGGSVVQVWVSFSTPTVQCAKKRPFATGVSGGSIDYNWMTASSASLPVSGTLDFAIVINRALGTALLSTISFLILKFGLCYLFFYRRYFKVKID